MMTTALARTIGALILALLAWPSSVIAQEMAIVPPDLIGLSRGSDGQAVVTLAAGVTADGFNIYRGADYITTLRPPLGVTEFAGDVGARGGDFCLVAFEEETIPASTEKNTRYSRCSEFRSLAPADPDIPDGEPPGPPSPPGSLRAVVYSPGVIELFWDRARDDGRVVAYRVTRDGEQVAFRNGRSYFESGLAIDREYEFIVTAIDDDGNEGNPALLLLRAFDDAAAPPPVDEGDGEPPPPPPVDNEQGGAVKPAPPANLRGIVYSPGVAEIFWDRSPDEARLSGYELLRDGERVVFRRGRSHFEPNLVEGEVYEYTLYAVGTDGTRSNPLVFSLRAGDPPPPVMGMEVFLTPERVSLIEGDTDGVDIDVLVQRGGAVSSDITLTLLDAGAEPMREFQARFERTTLSGDADSTTLHLFLPIVMAPRLPQQRTMFIRVEDGENVIDAPLTIEIEPVDAPDVYLLIGQSNMEGYSEKGSKRDGPGEVDEPVERVQQLHVQSSNPLFFATPEDFVDEAINVNSPLFIRAEDPLHDRLWPRQPRKSGTAIGPGLSFGKATLATTSADVYLVPAAWGATGFCGNAFGDIAWNAETPDDPALGNTLLLDRALVRLNMTLRETGGILRGILWHQGGADSNILRCGELYAENIVKMVERLRREARVDARGVDARGNMAAIPFIVATQSRGSDERGDFSFYGPPKVLVDSAQRSIGTLVPFADVVINDDLVPPAYPCGQNSCVHFGATALREQGSRFQAALERIRASYTADRQMRDNELE